MSRQCLAALCSVSLLAVSFWMFVQPIGMGRNAAGEDVRTIESMVAKSLTASQLKAKGLSGSDIDASSIGLISERANSTGRDGTGKLSPFQMFLRVFYCCLALGSFAFLLPAFGLYSTGPFDYFLNHESRQEFVNRSPLVQWWLSLAGKLSACNFIAQVLATSYLAYQSSGILTFVISILLLVVGVFWVLPGVVSIHNFCCRFQRGEFRDYKAERTKQKSDRFTVRDDALDDLQLLPSQVDIVKQLIQYFKSVNGHRPTQATLSGGWGTGKSTIVHNLDNAQYDTQFVKSGDEYPDRELVVVNVSVWRYADPLTFEKRLFLDIFDDTEVCRRGGWTICPPTSLDTRTIVWLAELWSARGFLKSEKGRQNSLGTADVFPPAEIKYRKQFMKMAKILWDQNALLVVVIDEIDRVSSDMAQTALTVINRSMNLREVAILTSADVDHLIAKAFRPTQMQAGDLRATVFTDLEKEIVEESDFDAALLVAKRLKHAFSEKNSEGSDDGDVSKSSGGIKILDDVSPEEQVTYRSQYAIDGFLLEQYYQLDILTRKKLDENAFRRYAPQRRIRIHLGSDDYDQFLVKVVPFDSIPLRYRKHLREEEFKRALRSSDLGLQLSAKRKHGSLREIESMVSEALSTLDLIEFKDDSPELLRAKTLVAIIMRVADTLELDPPKEAE